MDASNKDIWCVIVSEVANILINSGKEVAQDALGRGSICVSGCSRVSRH
jgi:hypothetical protein